MTRTLAPALAAALAEIDTRLRARFAGRLRFVRLFGSWARHEATEASDVDLAVIVEGLTADERREVLDAVHLVESSHELVFSAFLMTAERFDALARRRAGVAQAILEEGIAP